MSDYTKTVDFAAKDALATLDPAKEIKGTEIDTEFNAIATAIATKAEAVAATQTNITIDGTWTFSSGAIISGSNGTIHGGTYSG